MPIARFIRRRAKDCRLVPGDWSRLARHDVARRKHPGEGMPALIDRNVALGAVSASRARRPRGRGRPRTSWRRRQCADRGLLARSTEGRRPRVGEGRSTMNRAVGAPPPSSPSRWAAHPPSRASGALAATPARRPMARRAPPYPASMRIRSRARPSRRKRPGRSLSRPPLPSMARAPSRRAVPQPCRATRFDPVRGCCGCGSRPGKTPTAISTRRPWFTWSSIADAC